MNNHKMLFTSDFNVPYSYGNEHQSGFSVNGEKLNVTRSRERVNSIEALGCSLSGGRGGGQLMQIMQGSPLSLILGRSRQPFAMGLGISGLRP